MRKYDPLQRHLKRRGGGGIELSFADIERIIGAMLPNRAQRPQWWANESDPMSPHVQSRAWLEAGYDAFLLPRRDGVRFVRRAK